MTDFQVGEWVADVPYYNWKQHEAGVPLAEIPDVRYGEVVGKRMMGSYTRYTVRYGLRSEDSDGINLVSVEAKP